MQRDKLSDDRLPAANSGWKQLLWHNISSAAKVKDAFEENDYDSNGDLKLHSAKFAELYTWLDSRRSEAQFKTIRPAWRRVADSRWELTFLAVKIDAEVSAGTKQRICRKTTGITVEGLVPADQISEEWVLIYPEEIPGQGELLEENEDGYCDIM